MEPSNPRSEGPARGRRTFYGRRNQSNQNWPQHDGRPHGESDSTSASQLRSTEEPERRSNSEQGRSLHFQNPRQRGHRNPYRQEVPSQEYHRNGQESRNHYKKRGNGSEETGPAPQPGTANPQPENIGSREEQASSSDVQSSQNPREPPKKNWHRERNRHGFERRPDYRQGSARAEDGYERQFEPRGEVEHQPYDNVRGRYTEQDYRQKKWAPSSRGRFGRRSETGPQERSQIEAQHSREESRGRDEADYSRDYREGSTAPNVRDFDYGASQASRRYDRKPPRYREKPGGYGEPSDYTTRQYESYRDRRKPPAKPKEDAGVADSATQRERLTHQLTSGNYECMVCYESVKQMQPIWNCGLCYHAFHLQCIQRWAKKSQDENSQWRCPGCQSVNSTLPSVYLCYCQKRKDPEWNRREVPHSCGEVCGRSLGDGVACTHTCTILCHPGPCPVCSAQTQRTCPCGKSSKIVKCGSSSALLCGDVCGKLLSCGLHTCQELCHVGPCGACPIKIKLDCFCGRSSKEIPCSSQVDVSEKYCCDLVCSKELSCGHHKCEESCHPDSCKSCKLEVGAVTTCPCGKTPLEKLYKTRSLEPRKKCTDLVPVCGKICGRIFSCGPPENPHTCTEECHAGSCPPCSLKTTLRCRCGRAEKDIPCKDLSNMDEVLCERRCNKKRQCGRHKCVQACCIDIDHICPLVCGRTLSCGLHRCEALCHTGNCIRCHRVSFDELRCHCGTQVIYPPVPCGTRPPECNKPCTRTRPCGHPQQHNCHSDPSCPPCTTLCEKYCYGKHELRKNIPCHVTEVSCGKSCGRPLKCGRHTCPVTCHKGSCPDKCTQPCPEVRPECGHPCAVPCHKGPCPTTSCREKIKVQCQCGQRSATVSCEENEVSYRKLATGLLASKMAQMQSGQSVDLKDLLGNSNLSKTKCLECNEECALVERNRRLALALQIKNPNPKPGAPLYTEFLKEWAKKDPRFAQMVHDKLTELVQLAKQSAGKMKSRSYSFEPMNRDKRQFIHEYCAFFGCESMSYDDEPKRNVVATAIGEVSFLPAVGIVDVIRRELGQRKMPAPPKAGGTMTPAPGLQLSAPQPAPVASAWGQPGSGPFRTLSEVVRSAPSAAKPSASEPARSQPKANEIPVLDYFDFTS